VNCQTNTVEAQQLKEYLENVVAAIKTQPAKENWMYQRYEQLVLSCGFLMESKPLPPTITSGASGHCYWNCQQLALEDSSLTYIEGYALHTDVGFPLAHAWLLDADGLAIDPTWDTPGCYFGIPLSTAWVQSFLEARNRPDSLSIFDANYLEGYSLLRDGLPSSALAQLIR
jgi:hypothetical protein